MAFLALFNRHDLEPFTVLALDQATAEDGRSSRPDRREKRKLFGRFRESRDARRAATVYARERFEAAVAAGDVAVDENEPPEGRLAKFFAWCLAHKDEIIAFIKLIMGAFGGGVPIPGAAPEAAFATKTPDGAQAFPMGSIDVDLVASIATALNVTVDKAKSLWLLLKGAAGTLSDAA